jgi:hypothetical protein
LSRSDSEANRYSRRPQNEAAYQERDSKAAETASQDFVLVEGPKPKVESLLTALDKNSSDYLRVDVNDGSSIHEGAAVSRTSGDKSLKEIKDHFSTLDRTSESDPRGANADFDYYYTKLNQSAGEYSTPEGGPGIETDDGRNTTIAGKIAGTDLKSQSNEARAFRFDWSEGEQKQSSERAFGGGRGGGGEFQDAAQPKPKAPMAQKKLQKAAKGAAPNDTIKVLFVLSSEDRTVPSAPPANAPK